MLASTAMPVTVVLCAIDGDTFDATNGEKVRVLNINTPELGTEEGKWAYLFARRLVKGQKVKLVPEGNQKGKYGRFLYHLILKDGSNFAAKMIRRGHSKYITKYGVSKIYGKVYKKAENEARRERLGVWKFHEITKR